MLLLLSGYGTAVAVATPADLVAACCRALQADAAVAALLPADDDGVPLVYADECPSGKGTASYVVVREPDDGDRGYESEAADGEVGAVDARELHVLAWAGTRAAARTLGEACAAALADADLAVAEGTLLYLRPGPGFTQRDPERAVGAGAAYCHLAMLKAIVQTTL